MRKIAILSILFALITGLVSFIAAGDETKRLRKIYSRPSSQWPQPWVEEGII